MDTQLDLFNKNSFDGTTYEPKQDDHRLIPLIKELFIVMSDSKFRTLPELEKILKHRYMITSISSKLRDLRKEKFGGHIVNRQNRGDRKNGFYEYQLIIKN